MELSRGTMKKLLALITFVVALYTALEHLALTMAALGFVWGVLTPFLVGGALAFILNVPMRFLERKLFPPPRGKKKRLLSDGARRGLSLLLTLALAAAVLLVLALVVAPQLAESVSGLGYTIMDAVRRLAAWAEETFVNYPSITQRLENLALDWKSLLASAWELLTSGVGSVVTSTISAANRVISALTNGFVALVFALYLLLQKEKLGLQCRKALYALLPERTAGRIVEVCSLSHRVFSSFITGQCAEAVILGFLFFVCMSLLQMPYALLVGCVIAVTALIPIVGAFIGCGVGVFLLLMVSPMQALVFLIMFLVLQQVEGNLIYPHVVGSSVGLPSIWVLAAVTLGGSLMGVLGMLLFIPLSSVLYTLFREFVYKRLREKKIKVV